MKNWRFIFFTLIIIGLVSCEQQKVTVRSNIAEFSIIPQPNNLTLEPNFKTQSEESFLFQGKLRIIGEGKDFIDLRDLAVQLLDVELGTEEDLPLLILRGQPIGIPQEAYRLDVHKDSIVITASSGHGIFYGIQSLAQILPVDRSEVVQIPVCQINDWPRFSYRGMHLDVCRHFYSVDFVKKYIDLMARYKLNTFHWHLTEDQGWRIEIKKYPKLTSIGAWRWEKDSTGTDSVRYGGFYTQDQIREVVDYAAKRFITIIPEIEMPGHSRAALAGYPQFSCSGEELPVATTWGVFDHVYCAGNDSTFLFIQDILKEVIELFPGEYVHIGGDECPKAAWEKCPKCQHRIKEESLADEHELQSYFIRRIEQFLHTKERKLIGWDEILEGGLAPDATVMSWQGISGGIAAAKQAHDVVMTPGTHCYFDHYQGNPKYEPKAIGGYTSLEKVYFYEPIPEELNNKEAQFILGAQANLWTEYIATEHHLEYMLLPRMLALAEVNWTLSKNKNWKNFQKRLQPQLLKFDREGTNYCPGDYTIHFQLVTDSISGDSLIVMSSEIYQAKIQYTTDGEIPSDQSTEYNEPIKAEANMVIRAAIFESGQVVNGYTEFQR